MRARKRAHGREWMRQYYASPKGRAASRRYQASDAGRARRRAYDRTDARKANKRLRAPRYLLTAAAWRRTPAGILSLRATNQKARPRKNAWKRTRKGRAAAARHRQTEAYREKCWLRTVRQRFGGELPDAALLDMLRLARDLKRRLQQAGLNRDRRRAKRHATEQAS